MLQREQLALRRLLVLFTRALGRPLVLAPLELCRRARLLLHCLLVRQPLLPVAQLGAHSEELRLVRPACVLCTRSQRVRVRLRPVQPPLQRNLPYMAPVHQRTSEHPKRERGTCAMRVLDEATAAHGDPVLCVPLAEGERH